MMRVRSQFEKWGVGILGVVCLALLLNLIFSKGVPANAARPEAPKGRPGVEKNAARDELAHYDPELNLELLKQIESQPLPQLSRNPFEFPPPPAPPKPAIEPGASQAAVPPPPPPLPLKAIGYSVKEGGVPEAVIVDDQDIYVVHIGETFAKRFRVLTLTPSNVEIEDASTQQTVQLPIAP